MPAALGIGLVGTTADFVSWRQPNPLSYRVRIRENLRNQAPIGEVRLDNQRSPWSGSTRGPSAHGLDPWASTSYWALVISSAKAWMPGSSPGKGRLQLYCGSRGPIPRCRNYSTGQPKIPLAGLDPAIHVFLD